MSKVDSIAFGIESCIMIDFADLYRCVCMFSRCSRGTLYLNKAEDPEIQNRPVLTDFLF
jgi:hypothetical protein